MLYESDHCERPIAVVEWKESFLYEVSILLPSLGKLIQDNARVKLMPTSGKWDFQGNEPPQRDDRLVLIMAEATAALALCVAFSVRIHSNMYNEMHIYQKN